MEEIVQLLQTKCLLTVLVFTLSEGRPFFRDPQPLFRDPKTVLTKLANLALVMPCCFVHKWGFEQWCMNIAEEFSKPTWHSVEKYGCHGSGQCWFGKHTPQWQVTVPYNSLTPVERPWTITLPCAFPLCFIYWAAYCLSCAWPCWSMWKGLRPSSCYLCTCIGMAIPAHFGTNKHNKNIRSRMEPKGQGDGENM